MGLNRTPTAILEARGSFINHKNRKAARAGEPVVTKRLGSPPKTFTDEQKKLWHEFAKIVPPRVATYADRWAVEIVVCAMAKFRAGSITGAETGQLTSLLSDSGLRPPTAAGLSLRLRPSRTTNGQTWTRANAITRKFSKAAS